MTLHEAMQQILQKQKDHTMHRADLAHEIETQNLYAKGDKSAINPNQISARASQYPELFKNSDSGYISLI